MSEIAWQTEASQRPAPRRRLRFAVELSLWLLGRRRRYRATGRSMEPTLSAGDHLFVESLAPPGGASVGRVTTRCPEVGQLVVARHPEARRILVIKRVGRAASNQVWLSSDNPECGTDSRHFGPVRLVDVVGRVTASIDQGGHFRVH